MKKSQPSTFRFIWQLLVLLTKIGIVSLLVFHLCTCQSLDCDEFDSPARTIERRSESPRALHGTVAFKLDSYVLKLYQLTTNDGTFWVKVPLDAEVPALGSQRVVCAEYRNLFNWNDVLWLEVFLQLQSWPAQPDAPLPVQPPDETKKGLRNL